MRKIQKDNLSTGGINESAGGDNGNESKEQISLQIGNEEWREMMLDRAEMSAIPSIQTRKLNEHDHEKIVERKVQRDTIGRIDKANAKRAAENAVKAEEMNRRSDDLRGNVQRYYTNVYAYKRIVKLGMINTAKHIGEQDIYLKYGRDGACKEENKRNNLLKRVHSMGESKLSSYTGLGHEDVAIENAYNNGVTPDEYIPKTLAKYL